MYYKATHWQAETQSGRGNMWGNCLGDVWGKCRRGILRGQIAWWGNV